MWWPVALGPPDRSDVRRRSLSVPGFDRVVDRDDPLDRLVFGAMDDDEMDTILDALERATKEDETSER